MTQTAKRQLSVRLSVLFAAVLTTFLLIGGAAEAEGPPPPTTEYVVTAGDSLWAIAQSHTAPGGDVRRLVAEIQDLSGLETSTIHPGQILVIPEN